MQVKGVIFAFAMTKQGIIKFWIFNAIILIAGINQSFAQLDTLTGESQDVVVTATRTERKLSNVAVPAFIISQKELQGTQLRRLNEILQEQTGIFVTSGSGSGGFGGGIFGNGAQLQGMSPEYTLILVNGEPIIGRQGGGCKSGPPQPFRYQEN
jgi:outer membrane receptor for ferrienterochelin and colicins